MRKHTQISGVVAALISAVVLQGCSSQSSDTASSVPADCKPAHQVSTIQPGKIIVSTYVAAPYATLPVGGRELGGIDGDIIKKIAQKECLAVDARPVEGAAFVSSVTSNRADVVIGAISYREDRAKIMNMSEPMYHNTMAMLAKDSYSSTSSMRGKRIGALQGYYWNDQLINYFGTDNVVVYQDAAGVVNDLNSGRLDIGIMMPLEAQFRAKGTNLKVADVPHDPAVPATLAPTNVVLASTKGNDSLTAAFNANITDMLKSGTITQIMVDNGVSPDYAGPAAPA